MTVAIQPEANPGQFERVNGRAEALFSPETLDLVAGVGNHEAKALLMVYLGEDPSYMRWSEMGNGFQEFLGDETEWEHVKALAFGYCERSFEPIGQVIEGQVERDGKFSKAYSITDQGKEAGVPLAGLLLKWSLDNPDISLQQIFGATRSAGSTRAPQNRIELLAELLTAQEQGLSLAGIAGGLDDDGSKNGAHNKLNNIRSAAEALERHGFITVERDNEGNTRQFLIEDPNEPEMGTPIRGALISAVYDFIQERFSEGKPLFNYEECLEHVVTSFKESDGTEVVDEAAVREKLSLLLISNLRSLPGVKRLETFNGGAHTKVSLNEEHRKALEDLIVIIMAVDDRHAETMRAGKEAAREIAVDTSLKGQLMSKAREFSPNVRRQPVKQTAEEIKAILAETDGAIDTDTIGRLYEQKHQRSLTEGAVQVVMRWLVKEGDAEVTRDRAKNSIRTTRNHYSSAVSEAN